MINRELIKIKFKLVEAKVNDLNEALSDLNNACKESGVAFDDFYLSIVTSLRDELKYEMEELDIDCGN